ncbi:DEAD/DEAH box helicase [Catalinimonas niigatensis]|uniref:DEAD/DEAH box helicase n=1 Tax=Catalinimonas niigatensis TaxID=1397264 RepID=UPI0026652929|nr:SNF2-related protein [Catalinimonas niigatensis]WPP53512.1 SNF2-related protein [Catalinimonas niigatensis]
MKVSTERPFRIIYSLYLHEYLGHLFESFAVQLDDRGEFTFEHQNISSKNAHEFACELSEEDYELIQLMDTMQQEAVINKFHKKKIKTPEFFYKIYEGNSEKNQQLRQEIEDYLEKIRAHILPLLKGKRLFEMSNDGEPVGKEVEVLKEKATVLFHFRRNEDNTHYFPTIKYDGQKVDFQYKDAYIVCKQPAWMVLSNKLYSFEKDVDGNKLSPFLSKKFIMIPRKVEDSYYRKFVASLVASFDVYAKGFEIQTERFQPVPQLNFYELYQNQPELVEANSILNQRDLSESDKICFELSFLYGNNTFKTSQHDPVSVVVEKQKDDYIFHRIIRNSRREQEVVEFFQNRAVEFRKSKAILDKSKAFEWINQYKQMLAEEGIELHQQNGSDKKYFLGESSINIEVRENIDWFDIYAKVKFGSYEIPFQQIRELILNKQRELKLPNGEIAVIPEVWFTDYSELFAFSEDKETQEGESVQLKKYHLALVQDLQNGSLAKVTMDRKLDRLREFSQIEDQPLPNDFEGILRPYQKAGYNWMSFLNAYNFGGCLADDMGLGKTVQTLALLQMQKEQSLQKSGADARTSLLVMPTSLIYNWEMEAAKFTPSLKVFIYAGTNRDKNVEQFQNYDLVLTSYGIIRLDVDILKKYYFNYVILDESQAIKNPDSNIAQAVQELNSRFRLILTGTPLENSTLDLWSQMTFINPGLLGSQSFFKNEFVQPIEKKGDMSKTAKLYTIIKPFILRRQKWQVAKELPEKVENVQYCTMTDEQEACYEEAKSFYRNEILNLIETKGVNKSQLLLLQGLTKLRQIANHPKMVDEKYKGGSGKLEDTMHMLLSAISEGHKILVFSQFVKHLSLLTEQVEKQGIPFAYLDGSTKNRKEQVERFQNDDSLRLFLISLRAGGVGLNLTKADYVFILDPWWNPAIEQQAIDRAHRIGQENQVFTYKFISRNTVEEKILKLQENKRKLATELISTEESFMKKLTKEDISAILE